jgi:hypothetical protein
MAVVHRLHHIARKLCQPVRRCYLIICIAVCNTAISEVRLAISCVYFFISAVIRIASNVVDVRIATAAADIRLVKDAVDVRLIISTVNLYFACDVRIFNNVATGV